MFMKYKHTLKFQLNWKMHCEDIGMLKSMFLSFIIVERSGKFSDNFRKIKLVTSLLVSSRNAGKLKLLWFQVYSDL